MCRQFSKILNVVLKATEGYQYDLNNILYQLCICFLDGRTYISNCEQYRTFHAIPKFSLPLSIKGTKAVHLKIGYNRKTTKRRWTPKYMCWVINITKIYRLLIGCISISAVLGIGRGRWTINDRISFKTSSKPTPVIYHKRVLDSHCDHNVLIKGITSLFPLLSGLLV